MLLYKNKRSEIHLEILLIKIHENAWEGKLMPL